MIVVTLTDCPPKLRGDLSMWLMEINTGVYVGKVSARVREELWTRICENVSHGRATMVYSAKNEQGMEFRVHNTSWEPVDFDGIKLMRRPLPDTVQTGTMQRSKAAVRQIINAKNAQKTRKKNQEGYVVVDIETTGLKSETDEIIELAAVRVVEHKIAAEFSALIKPECALPKVISDLTGITQEMLDEDGRALPEAMNEFLDFIGTSPMVGHNIAFDRAFLNAACEKLEKGRVKNVGKDTLQLARRRVDDISDYKLKTLANYFKIETDGMHRALADCKIIAQLYEKLNEL